jgi:CRP-like cAMP-binding protein/Ca2+/Na+ antiporter
MTAAGNRTYSWTSYNLPYRIQEVDSTTEFLYGPERQRIRQAASLSARGARRTWPSCDGLPAAYRRSSFASSGVAMNDAAQPPAVTTVDEPPKPGEILRRLSAIEILRALPPEEVQEVVRHVELLDVPAGHVLMRAGDPGDALYLVESGTARVQLPGRAEPIRIGAGTAVGEAALLSGAPRNATVTAETALCVWRISREAFDTLVAASPNLRHALEDPVESRLTGAAIEAPSREYWVATALRAVEARNRSLTLWELLMAVGLIAWVGLAVVEHQALLDLAAHRGVLAFVQLAAGLLIIQGSCEAFIHGVERLGARLRWDGFISGTVGSVLSTAPEFFVIAFLVQVDPLAAFVTAAVTIYNNALAFSIYSFFLPKDKKGAFRMPRSLTAAGGEILIAGGAVALIVGAIMVLFKLDGARSALAGADLLVIGSILMGIYGYYLVTLVRYYGEGGDDTESHQPEPARLGHDTSWGGIGTMFVLGIVGAYCGGESIGAFAETALGSLGLPTIPTAAALALFAGVSEYIIVYKSHRRGELGIALSNVFGGMTQVMFLLLPFSLVAIGVAGLATGSADYVIPVNMVSIMLVLLLFPLFYALHQYITQEKTLSDLDAAAMTGIYVLLLYFLFTAG